MLIIHMVARIPTSRAVEGRAGALAETYWPSYRASPAGLVYSTAIRSAFSEGLSTRSTRHGTCTAGIPTPFSSSPTWAPACGSVRVEPVDILAVSAAAEAVLQHGHEGSTARRFNRRGDAQRHAPSGRRLVCTVYGMVRAPIASIGRKTGTRPCTWRFERRQAALCPPLRTGPCD